MHINDKGGKKKSPAAPVRFVIVSSLWKYAGGINIILPKDIPALCV